MEKLAKWRLSIEDSGIPEMQNFAHQVNRHKANILNYFNTRKTNAAAEGFNSHLQRFFMNNYGIRNRYFFHFRIKGLDFNCLYFRNLFSKNKMVDEVEKNVDWEISKILLFLIPANTGI